METNINEDFFDDVNNLDVDNDNLMSEVLQDSTTNFNGDLKEVDSFNEEVEEVEELDKEDDLNIDEKNHRKYPFNADLLKGQSKSIITMLELGNSMILPKLYEKKLLTNRDREILKEIKRNEVINESVVTYNPEQLNVLNKIAILNEYKDNLAFSEEEKKQLVDELFNYLKYQEVSMNPMTSLLLALGMIEGTRILPIFGIKF